jgi:hypothetical protein
MSNKQNNLIWGLVLIVLGGLFLVESLGFIPDFSQAFWAVTLGLACLFFVAVFVYGGAKHWGWLFPIFISGGLSLMIGLSFTDINETWIGALFMASVSAPFWTIYLLNRENHWWALIPGWVTAVITLIILVSERWSGETIGALVMWSIALPFIAVYLRNRQHWWALIPGFIMASIGVVVLLSNRGTEAIIGSFMMVVMAVPFLAVYFFSKGQWWAIIPAGIFTTLAFIIPFATGIEEGDTFAGRLVAVMILSGFAVPFGWLWWRQDVYPTAWAKYPVGSLVIAALITLLFGLVMEIAWPIILIVVGGWLLYNNLHHPQLKP